ncbi:hypothetical protein GA840_00915 [Pediococcus ethanolidurans]|uniref:hypothetical protein n=1 Tax=Pediococcus ethanolidurans TaxID=319653 RepID=UPI002953E2BA|nr:hypothetical protein [Pediococcus ethanolidurans]MDV7718448.1 hypothetical protein [Pediococcus ethanolidurans]
MLQFISLVLIGLLVGIFVISMGGAIVGAAIAPKLMTKFAVGRGAVILNIIMGVLLVFMGIKTLLN